MSDHTIVVIWVIKTSFVQFFCVFLLPLLNIFYFCWVHIISVLYCAFVYPCVKCSLGISTFLEVLSSLSHSIVILCFFALFTSEGFLISPCYSSELHSNGYIFPFLLCLSFLFFSVCKASSGNCFAFLPFFFLGMVLITTSCIMLQTSVHSSSGTLSIKSNPLNLFVISTI